MTHWNGIWYELFDLNLWYDMLFDPPVWYYEPNLFPSHEGNMAVSLMHQWHDSSVVEWCSTPSPFDMICALYELLWLLRLVCGGVWMHPRFVFVSRDISWFVFGLVTDVCAIHVFHIIWEWQLQPLRHPLMLHLVSRGHPSGYIIFGLIWFGLVVDYYSYNLCSCSCFLTLILLYRLLIQLVRYYYLLPLYLFTGLFKLSRIFFSSRQVLS